MSLISNQYLIFLYLYGNQYLIPKLLGIHFTTVYSLYSLYHLLKWNPWCVVFDSPSPSHLSIIVTNYHFSNFLQAQPTNSNMSYLFLLCYLAHATSPDYYCYRFCGKNTMIWSPITNLTLFNEMVSNHDPPA